MTVTYKGLKLCPHVLCVAETIGILDKYLEWRQKSKRQVNITSLVMEEIESGHKGKKVAKPRKRGRTPLEKEIPKQEIQRQLQTRLLKRHSSRLKILTKIIPLN